MRKFEFLDIATADVCFKAYGKTLEELFENIAFAINEIMIKGKIDPVEEREANIKANDLKSLVFEWINELLFFIDTEALFFSKFDIKVDEKNFTLIGKCFGEHFNEEKHEIVGEVKAPTYHKMEVKKEDDLWVAQVIVDI